MNARVLARRRWLVAIAITVIAAGEAFAEQGTVRVTVPRANVRAEPSEAGGVLTQEVRDTMLEFEAEQGDWFRVRLHIGAVRVIGYISKKVSVLVPADVPARASAPVPGPAPGLGISVDQQVGQDNRSMTHDLVRIRVVEARSTSIRELAGVLPLDDVPITAAGSTEVTFVWTLSGRAASHVAGERRPTFVVGFRSVPAPGLSPAIVRLAPTLSGVRILAARRGRRDALMRPELDPALARDLRQEMVRADVAMPEPGRAIVRPTGDLEPGEYALVFRPTATAGNLDATAVAQDDAGAVLSVAWPFSVR